MEVFSKDLIFGEFRLSDYGLIIGSFNYKGDSTDEIGMSPSTIEEFIGHNPVPTYLGQQYSNKLEFTVSVLKNPCLIQNDYFNEKDCRAILREITGKKGYQWTKFINSELDDDLWYRARVNNISYERMGGKIVGIIISFECDSLFAWSNQRIINIEAKANTPFYIFNNTDDLNNYVLPYVKIHANGSGLVSIKNTTDNWETTINFVGNETVVMDSKTEFVTTDVSSHSHILNDTNLHFFRFVPDKNQYISNKDVEITFIYRVPRKVGFTE